MNSYVDYNFYKDIFGGDNLSPKDFTLYEFKARKFIDKITFNRVNSSNIDNDIKFTICIIAESIKKFDDEGIKTSETVGKHSVSFFIPQNSSIYEMLYKEASKYLPDNLLYRGI